MNMGLIDVDGHNFPNLALMKISAHHKAKGDHVEWSNIGNYDRTYMSKIFTFTSDYIQTFANLGEIIKGGSAYNYSNLLDEIEHIMPDYSIYNTNKAYGFLTRGCPKKCSWCIVPKKEGNIKQNADITEFWNGQKEAILLDNNVLASDHGLRQIEKIAKLGIRIDFNQGLDARLIDNSIAKLLSKVKWIRFLRMACDTKSQIPYIDKALLNLNKYEFKNYKVFVYVLVKDIEDAHERIIFLKEKGCIPFAQPYRDFENEIEPTNEQKRFARWVNHKAIFNSISFENYKG